MMAGKARRSRIRAHMQHTDAALDFQWMPFALRWYFMIVPTALSFILALIVMVLRWYSQKHNGLGSESAAMFV
jgi:hypothetical protein